MGEHVYGLDRRNRIIPAQDREVAGLGGRIAADIDDPFRGGAEDDLGDIR